MMLQNEINNFNQSIIDWSNNWAAGYCINNNRQSSDFTKDINLYFPTYFVNSPEIDFHNRTISFANLQLRNNFNIDKQQLTRWKYSARDFNRNYQNAIAFNTFEEIDNVFSIDSSLVSLIYWKHICRPDQYPIFDQRTMRAFSILNGNRENFLWIGGVPNGNALYQYYNEIYKPQIINSVPQNLPIKEKLLSFRKIDYALFSFDKFIISKAISKRIPVNRTVSDLLDEKLLNHNLPEYSFLIE